MLKTGTISYQDRSVVLEGFYAVDTSVAGKKPAVLIAHDWSGRNDFVCQKAEKIAELGYVGFALDLYGKGKIGTTNEEKMALMQPFMDDRALLVQRMKAAENTVRQIEHVDATRLAAMGFCFGGLCVLDLARSGAALRGVVSFHGLLNAPELSHTRSIQAKILALHGHDDPMVSPEQVLLFEQEMTAAGADWQLHAFGNTKHAFTNPLANDPSFGTVYNKLADARSWLMMKNFFAECLI